MLVHKAAWGLWGRWREQLIRGRPGQRFHPGSKPCLQDLSGLGCTVLQSCLGSHGQQGLRTPAQLHPHSPIRETVAQGGREHV